MHRQVERCYSSDVRHAHTSYSLSSGAWEPLSEKSLCSMLSSRSRPGGTARHDFHAVKLPIMDRGCSWCMISHLSPQRDRLQGHASSSVRSDGSSFKTRFRGLAPSAMGPGVPGPPAGSAAWDVDRLRLDQKVCRRRACYERGK